MNRYWVWWLGLVVGLVFTVPAKADLLGRSPATPGGTDYQAAYDDVLDITWVTDAGLSGRGTWDEQVAWAEGLELLGANDWRLASISVSAGVPTGDAGAGVPVGCSSAGEQACQDNELGYMYYHNLGGSFPDDLTGNQTVDGVTLTDIQSQYWSGTQNGDTQAFDLYFDNGSQGIDPKFFTQNGWAVRDGDIGLLSMSSAIVASSLPSSRSVQVGNSASAFATIINSSDNTAIDCGIAPLTEVSAEFVYQATDASNAPVGMPNTPVNIAVGESQNFTFAFTPTAPISPTDVQLSYDCSNSEPALITSGLNTLLLSASNDPVPDIVALSATPTGDGIVNLLGVNGSNAFSVATVNIGSGDMITASAVPSTDLPISLSICETNPDTAACVIGPASSVASMVNPDDTPTYSIFVIGEGIVRSDLANNRIIVEFKDASDVVRGSTSVAVRTQPPAPPSSDVVSVFVTSGKFDGNLGGLAGADAICQAAADAAQLGGTWTAWFSDDNNDAIDRIPDGQYQLLDGTLVANDKADLTDDLLESNINLTEIGITIPGFVWTGTEEDGTNTSLDGTGILNNCNNWTDNSSGSTGARGVTDANQGGWTYSLGADAVCSDQNHLYCFGGVE